MSNRAFEIRILESYCKGCGLCVDVCAEGKLRINPQPNKRGFQPAVADPEVECGGCLRCATICPDAAIEIRRLAPVPCCVDAGQEGLCPESLRAGGK